MSFTRQGWLTQVHQGQTSPPGYFIHASRSGNFSATEGWFQMASWYNGFQLNSISNTYLHVNKSIGNTMSIIIIVGKKCSGIYGGRKNVCDYGTGYRRKFITYYRYSLLTDMSQWCRNIRNTFLQKEFYSFKLIEINFLSNN